MSFRYLSSFASLFAFPSRRLTTGRESPRVWWLETESALRTVFGVQACPPEAVRFGYKPGVLRPPPGRLGATFPDTFPAENVFLTPFLTHLSVNHSMPHGVTAIILLEFVRGRQSTYTERLRGETRIPYAWHALFYRGPDNRIALLTQPPG
jgi:hypothetical protein